MIKKMITEAMMKLSPASILAGSIKTTIASVENIAPDMPNLAPSIFWQRSLFDTLDGNLRFECKATNKSRQPDDWKHIQCFINDAIQNKTIDNFSLDLRKLGGVVNSKSAAHGVWRTFEEFGRSENCSSIPKATPEDFAYNTKHSFESRPPLRFYRNAWEDLTIWGNDDGSHHAAAAHVQALDDGFEYILTGTLYQTSLDAPSIINLNRQTKMVVVNKTTYWGTLIDKLESLNVEHGSMDFNNEHGQLTALVFPKDNSRSVEAAECLIANCAFDFNSYMHECLTAQNYLLTRKPSTAPGF